MARFGINPENTYGVSVPNLRQIAKEAGVADGTIYLYFKNKDDILVQFFNYKTKQVFDSFRTEVARADSSLDKLRYLIRRQLLALRQEL